MDPGWARENPSPKLGTRRGDSEHARSDRGADVEEDKDELIKSLIFSYKSDVPEPAERNVQQQHVEPVKARRAVVSVSETAPTTTLPSLSIAQLSRQCVSAFESCVRHESLMDHQWAENRFADFNLFVDGVGALSSSSRASLDSRFESRPDDLVLVKSVLTMLMNFLIQCISCAESGSSTDAATKKVDSSLENLALIAVAIRKTGMRSRLERADGRFKRDDYKELEDFLRIMCLRQRTGNNTGEDARKDADKSDYKFKQLSTQECIDTSKDFKLSEPQQRLIEVNLRRRNRFIRAQEHSEKMRARQREPLPVSIPVGNAREEMDDDRENLPNIEALSLGSSKRTKTKTKDMDHKKIHPEPTIPETKASTAEGSFQVRKAKRTASQPAMTAITILTAAAQYPKPPEACQKSTMFKCPCCCQTLPAEFGTNKDLWKKHLAEDISPYTCILPDCPTPFTTYNTVLDWERHFKKEHRPCRVCPLCENTDTVFLSMEDLATHIETAHAETASPDFVLTAISWSGVTTIGVDHCPLCESTGPEHAPEFVRHVLSCIHDFSLCSLPWAGYDLVEASQHVWACKLEMLGDEKGPMRRWLGNRDDEVMDGSSLVLHLRRYDSAQVQGSHPTNDYFDESENEFFGIASAQDSLEVFKRSLRSWDQEEEDINAIGGVGLTDAGSVTAEAKDEFEKGPGKDVGNLNEDPFGNRCKQLCNRFEQWVLRFSKFSDMRASRLTTEINDEKIIDRLDNTVLDGSDVDIYLADRVKRRDIFMSLIMSMVWEFIFTRYLFGMDREQRQKLKALEKVLVEIGPPQAVRQWRAITLALLSKRQNYTMQCEADTDAVVHEIYSTFCKILPPPSNQEHRIQSQLRPAVMEAVGLSVDMRTQKAEYMMLPPLQPEYDAEGELSALTYFNASLMNEHSRKWDNKELEAQSAVVRNVLFPLVVKKGDDDGLGDEEIVVSPAQVLVAPLKATNMKSSDARKEEAADSSQKLVQKDQIQSLTFSEHLFHHLDEDYFDERCQQLCRNIQQWVLRFSKYSDRRVCRLTNEIGDDKIIDRLDNAVLDGSDVDLYLSDRVKRRDIFMAITMNMIWEHIFTRYLFGLDREQRQKIKSMESLLAEVGPLESVRQWRAISLTMLSKRESFNEQRDSDTEGVVQEIFKSLCKMLPPPSNMEEYILSLLRRCIAEAVSLSIEMRIQKAEYQLLPPLQPEYDENGDLIRKVTFNASLMNERSGKLNVTNEELEAKNSVVRVMLFPLVIKKGDDNGYGEDEVVIFPGQVLVSGSTALHAAAPSSVGTRSQTSI